VKRRPIVGISVAILVLSVIIGIASLPDEVLIESSSIDNSETVPEEIILPPKEESQAPISDLTDNKNIDATKEEINALKKEIIELKNEIVQIKKDPEVSQDIPIITEEKNQTVENSQNVSQGKVITISIKDGVGSKSR
jgi:HAMP domain-containing protein